METNIIEMIVTGAPNFIFAMIAVVALMRRLHNQDILISTLIQKWSDCENDNERNAT